MWVVRKMRREMWVVRKMKEEGDEEGVRCGW